MLQLLVREVLGEHPLHREVHAPAFEVAAPLQNVTDRGEGAGGSGGHRVVKSVRLSQTMPGAGAGAGSSDDG